MLQRLNQDFAAAFKEGNRAKKDFLGVIRGEIQTSQGRGISPTDENILKILKSIEKSLSQTLESKPGDEKTLFELGIVRSYLPTLMSENEVSTIVDSLIASGCSKMSDIMKEFNGKYRGQADNKVVQQIAMKKLQ